MKVQEEKSLKKKSLGPNDNIYPIGKNNVLFFFHLLNFYVYWRHRMRKRGKCLYDNTNEKY